MRGGASDRRKTPPYVISHRESKTHKLYNTGIWCTSFLKIKAVKTEPHAEPK
jgi:hypothetical protein